MNGSDSGLQEPEDWNQIIPPSAQRCTASGSATEMGRRYHHHPVNDSFYALEKGRDEWSDA